VEISLFSEFFLAEPNLLAANPNGFPKNAAVFQLWQHDTATRQEMARLN
jgi:hypothetical protein